MAEIKRSAQVATLLEIALSLPVNGADRRCDLELRVVFDEVHARVMSCYDASQSWGGSSLKLLVYRIVRESYPQLDTLQVQSLVGAMERLARMRRGRGVSRRPVAPELNEIT